MTTPKNENAELWIGLISLYSATPDPALEGATGAYTNVLTRAACDTQFEEQARSLAKGLGLAVVEVLWAVPLRQRLETGNLDARLWKVVEEIEKDGEPRFGPFHTWEQDDLAN